MGMVFGKVNVETPKFEVLHSCPDYEIRRYPPSVVAQVTYDPAQMRGDRDGGFMVLANYIGALGKPQNTRPEKIAMTAPVVTTAADASEKIAMTAPVITTTGGAGDASEKIAMTAPVITTTGGAGDASEKIAMTAPVITATGGAGDASGTAAAAGSGTVTMQFLLPSKYTSAEEAPTPADERVVIREEGERTYGVVKFSGLATDKVVADKVEKLRQGLERDGRRVTGRFLLARYNPPWTLPPFRTNEVMLPVE